MITMVIIIILPIIQKLIIFQARIVNAHDVCLSLCFCSSTTVKIFFLEMPGIFFNYFGFCSQNFRDGIWSCVLVFGS